MSTLTIDDELYQRALEVAAVQGKTVDAFIAEALRHVLALVGARRTVRNRLPVMVVSSDTTVLRTRRGRKLSSSPLYSLSYPGVLFCRPWWVWGRAS